MVISESCQEEKRSGKNWECAADPEGVVHLAISGSLLG